MKYADSNTSTTKHLQHPPLTGTGACKGECADMVRPWWWRWFGRRQRSLLDKEGEIEAEVREALPVWLLCLLYIVKALRAATVDACMLCCRV